MSDGKHRARGAAAGSARQGRGRHTARYVQAHREALGGLFPLGHAGRQSLEQLREGPQDRGDRYTAGSDE